MFRYTSAGCTPLVFDPMIVTILYRPQPRGSFTTAGVPFMIVPTRAAMGLAIAVVTPAIFFILVHSLSWKYVCSAPLNLCASARPDSSLQFSARSLLELRRVSLSNATPTSLPSITLPSCPAASLSASIPSALKCQCFTGFVDEILMYLLVVV